MWKEKIKLTDFTKILDKAKEIEAKMKESQEKIKNIKIEGVSGSNSVKVILNGDGEMIKIDISPDIIKEDKSIIEDLIVAAHNNAKEKLKSKTTEEISKVTGGFGIPGFKWPL
tara:strand:+ start:1394 stop:1732 length:339 start_codon:yes stop_codon:yes gene_type:complete